MGMKVMNREIIYNNKVLRDRRRELRNNQTEAEKILWLQLKGRKLLGFKFDRQYSVGPYILDFYCPKIRLAIELDGIQHMEKSALLYDQDRTRYLEALNIKVIRFQNDEVINNITLVLDKISVPLLR